jgi:polar amino acid transport system substrate-binding protein
MLCALILCFSPGPAIAGHSTTERIKERGVLLWGSDSEGGAPYVFPDPKDPTRLIGFELDIAEAVARRLGGSASGRSWCKQPGTA